MTNPQPSTPDADEIANAKWFKAKASTQGACVEIAHINDEWSGIRDTKNPGGPVNIIEAEAFRAFIEGAKAGRFDRR